MTVAEFIQQTYLLAAGKATAPSTNNYNKILALGNMFQLTWANEQGIDWFSLRQVSAIGTVGATDTYDMGDMGKVSSQEGDYVTILRLDGKQSIYTIVPISKLYSMSTGNADGLCARSGTTLVFDSAFLTTAPQFGGTINVPNYVTPDSLVNVGDEIQVDDPFWLCARSAAEYVRNDVTKQNQYGNLVALAVDSMDSMKEHNRSQREEVDMSEWRPLGQSW